MPISDARKRANEKYIKSQDEIKLRVEKGMKDKIKAHAKSKGMSSNAYINDLIKRDIEK